MDTKDLRGLMEAYSEVYAPQEVDEAVKGADPEMRKAASAERRGGDKRLSPSKGKGYATHAMQQAAYVDKKTKGKHIPGYAYSEEVEQLDELSDRKLRAYVKKSQKSHEAINKKWDQGTATEKEKLKSIGHEIGQERALKRLNKEELDIFDVVLEFLQVEGFAETLEEAEWLMANELDSEDIEAILEAEGSYGETPKAYSAALKTKMTAKRKPFLKAMQRRTNPANRKDAYASPRKGMTASDREEARAGAAHGSPRGHDYPSQGPGGVTKSAKKLRKQKAMGEFAKEDFELWVNSLVEEGYDLSNYTWDEMRDIYEEEQLNELSNRKMRAYIKKSQQSHKEINKKWDQGTATEKEKLKSIGHEIGQERAYKKLDKRVGR